jgi:hypothetical protein
MVGLAEGRASDEINNMTQLAIMVGFRFWSVLRTII